MKKAILLLRAAFMLLVFVSCAGKSKKNDRAVAVVPNKLDNKARLSPPEQAVVNFKSIKIGKQVWMAENLNVSTYRNGDSVLQVQNAETWNNLETGAFCFYENKVANGSKYGKLYNWYAANDPRGLAPKGWHIPSDAEWKQLIDYLGGEIEASRRLKNNSGWNECDGKSGNGNNNTGFSALPTGFRDFFGPFNSIGSYALWWSANEDAIHTNDGIFRCVCYNCSRVFRNNFTKRRGISVRCIKDPD